MTGKPEEKKRIRTILRSISLALCILLSMTIGGPVVFAGIDTDQMGEKKAVYEQAR